MATWATVADFEAYVVGWDSSSTDDDAVEQLLVKAERDLFPLVGLRFVNALTGEPLDPALIDDAILELGLKNATCAQAEYRFRMGPAHFATAQYEQVSGPDYSVKGKLPQIAPQARRELTTGGVTTRWARVI